MTITNDNSDLEEICKKLIARRVKVGAESPEGRRLSMLVEQLQNGSPFMAKTVREIEQIRRDGGEYIHANHFPRDHQ